MALTFSPTIEAGHILQAITILGGIFGAYVSLKADIGVQERRISVVEVRSEEQNNLAKIWREQVTTYMRDTAADIKEINRSLVQVLAVQSKKSKD